MVAKFLAKLALQLHVYIVRWNSFTLLNVREHSLHMFAEILHLYHPKWQACSQKVSSQPLACPTTSADLFTDESRCSIERFLDLFKLPILGNPLPTCTSAPDWPSSNARKIMTFDGLGHNAASNDNPKFCFPRNTLAIACGNSSRCRHVNTGQSLLFWLQ
jgi:hypothetical protein